MKLEERRRKALEHNSKTKAARENGPEMEVEKTDTPTAETRAEKEAAEAEMVVDVDM